jgi:glycine/D-amino acid oxidase-like deaminating enzyme
VNDRFDVAVVGAGIVGAACAARLAEGGLSVVVLERKAVGGGATAAGMGHIVVMDGSPAQLELTAFSRRLWDAEVEAMPSAVEHERCGTLWVATNEEQMAEAETKCKAYWAVGVDASLLSPTALAEAEPQLRTGLAGALKVGGDSVVYQPNAARWLLDRAAVAGAEWRIPAEVKRVEDGRIELTDGGTLQAEYVVLAAGTQTTSLLATRELDEAIVPRKGHLAITARALGICHHQLIELGYTRSAHGNAASSVAFNLQPRRTGQVLVGSSRQYGVTHDRVEPGIMGRMLRRALEFMPSLGRVPVLRTWTGFRPATADGLPLVGPAPGDPRTVLAAGHEGLGITTSLGTAALVESIVRGDRPPISLLPFAPERMLAGVGHA